MAPEPDDLTSAREEDRDLRDALRADDPAPTPQPGDDEPLARAWRTLTDATADIPANAPAAAGGNGPGRGRRRWLVGLGTAACLGLAGMIGFAAVSATLTGSSETVASDTTGGPITAGTALGADLRTEPGTGSANAPTEPGTGSANPPTEPGTGSATPPTEPGTAAARAAAPSTAVDSAAAQVSRDANAVVATDDVMSARNSLVATLESLGGTVVSESVSTSGIGAPVSPMADRAIYPPGPSGPGVSIYAEVPATAYPQAVASLGQLGDVVQLTQSSYDIGASVADTDARVASLEASLARLQGLLAQAADLSQVIELENAISSRQAELDGLKAQQKSLADQVEKARLSVQLSTPADADAYLGQQPGTWWERFLAGLAQAWLWLGRALAVAVPVLLVAWLVATLVRRRQASARRSSATTADS